MKPSQWLGFPFLPLVSLPAPSLPQFFQHLYLFRKTTMMNRIITALTFASFLSTCPLVALATEATEAATIPGTHPIPSESNEEKANKKGEEAAGSNSGADSETMKKDTGASDSKDDGTTQGGSRAGS
ncbi:MULTISPECIES: hypothetical protein [Pseudomonas]|uniref:hypothetical protein n=1 Tax=Pseudomonas TaxID=286 RepID=UPI00295847B8|nr:hypothetical protein [Pseudomonas sp. GL-RE-29]